MEKQGHQGDDSVWQTLAHKQEDIRSVSPSTLIKSLRGSVHLLPVLGTQRQEDPRELLASQPNRIGELQVQ